MRRAVQGSTPREARWDKVAIANDRVDMALVVLAAGVAAGAFLLMLFDVNLFVKAPTRAASAPAVARLGEVHHDVRRRPRDMPVWGEARADDELHEKDYVFTDKDAGAVLSFLDASQIELGENTLIAVEKVQDRQVLNVLKGSLRARVAPDAGGARGERPNAGGAAPPVLLKIGGRSEILRPEAGSEVAIRVDAGGKADVTVLAGRAELGDGSGKGTVVAANERAKLAPGAAAPTVAPVAVRLEVPADGATFGAEGAGGVALAWHGPAAAAYVAEVAKDDGFDEVVETRSVSAGSMSTKTRPLAPGTYYWRIRGDGDASAVRRFVVARTTGPTLYTPAAGQALSALDERAGRAVDLSWETLPGAKSYETEVAIDAGFRQVAATGQGVSSGFRTPALGPGTYQWRVRAAGGPWSTPGTFIVRALPPPEPPRLAAPAPGATVPAGTPAALSWEPSAGAAAYVVEILTGPAPLLTREVRGRTQWEWTPAAPGDYRWRVRTKDAYGRLSPAGEERAVEVLPAAAPVQPVPELGRPFLPPRIDIQLPDNTKRHERSWWQALFESEAFAEAADDPQAAFEVKIVWDPVRDAAAYRVQIAADAAFSAFVINEQVTASEWLPHDVEAGEYYIRVAAIGADGHQGPFSNVSRLGVHAKPVIPPPPPAPPAPPPPEPLAAPARLAPADGAELTLATPEPVVSFSWSKRNGASTYTLQIAHDEDFKDIVYQQRNRGQDANVELKPGEYYWRIAANRAQTQNGDWSDAWRLSVEHVTPPAAPAAPSPSPAAPPPAPPHSAAAPAPPRIPALTPHDITIGVAMAPSYFHYATEAAGGAAMKIDAVLFDSMAATGVWNANPLLSPMVTYQRTATILFRNRSADDPPGQLPIPVHPFAFTPAAALHLGIVDLIPGLEWREAVRFHRQVDNTLTLDDAMLFGPSLGIGVGGAIDQSWRLRLDGTVSRTEGNGSVHRADMLGARITAAYAVSGWPLDLDLGLAGEKIDESLSDDGSGEGTTARTLEETLLLGVTLGL